MLRLQKESKSGGRRTSHVEFELVNCTVTYNTKQGIG